MEIEAAESDEIVGGNPSGREQSSSNNSTNNGSKCKCSSPSTWCFASIQCVFIQLGGRATETTDREKG